MSEDTISRQAAIDAVHKDYDTILDFKSDGRTVASSFEDIINALPSEQPEPCDDPRADIYYLAEKIGIHRLYALVVELRGEPEPCEDAVSRKAVLDIVDHNRGRLQIGREVTKLPSVRPQRKKGKWIDETFKPWGLVHHPYKCDQCGEHSETDSDFCPNCGADMREPEDIPMEYFESGGR